MEEWVVTFGFSKENPKNATTPLAQQFHGQLNKATPQKTKGDKLEQGGFTSYFVKQGGKDRCWRCDGFHQKNDWLILFQTIATNPNPTLQQKMSLHAK